MTNAAGGKDKDARLAAIILAGGSSRRYGADNKLLVDVGGVPLIRRVALQLLASRAGTVIVATGFDAAAIRQALAGLVVAFVHNARHLEGMGTTVAAGAAALTPDVEAALITPGDLPELSTALIDRLLAMSAATGHARIVFPTLPSGEQRNPVIWPRRYFAELATLTGDAGARDIIKAHPDAILPVPIDTADSFVDIDRPEDLDAWRRRQTS